MTENFRKYGEAPHQIIVLHGGPGACGQVAPVARKISEYLGVIEPFQYGQSIAAQVHELFELILEKAVIPITLVGHSWGAWLAWIFAARHPIIVEKIILISPPSFTNETDQNFINKRKLRLNDDEFYKYNEFIKIMNLNDNWPEKFDIKDFENILVKADSFNSINITNEIINFDLNIYKNVWKEALEYRKNNILLNLAKTIDCNITVIHGNNDVHPYDGVYIPLSKLNKQIKFYLLENCGHYPWFEKYAATEFFEILKNELTIFSI